MPSLFAILLLVAGQTAVEVRVVTVDEETIAGTVESWNAEALTLAQRSESQSIPIEQVLRVDLPQALPLEEPTTDALVTLTDTTQLAVNNFVATGQRGSFELPVAGEGPTSIEANLSSVRHVRLMSVPDDAPAIAEQWQEMIAMQPAADLIVIRKPGAANLNFVEGILGNITSDTVQFTLDEQTLDVNRAKVFGVIYYRDAEQPTTPRRAAVVGPGLRLNVDSVMLVGNGLAARSPHLGEIRCPVESVLAVDYSVDRVQYLSDLEPLRIDWSPPPNLAITRSLVRALARDRGIYSSELVLAHPMGSLPAGEIGSSGLPKRITYSKGLAIRSRTEVAYRVPGGFRSFRAVAGIDPLTWRTGLVELRLTGDGKPLGRYTIAGEDAPIDIDCDVTGLRELTLVVDFGSPRGYAAGTGDNLNLGGARFTK